MTGPHIPNTLTDDNANTDDCGRDDVRPHHFGRFSDALGGEQRRDGCPFRREITGWVARSPVAAFGRASRGYLLIVAAPAEHTTSS